MLKLRIPTKIVLLDRSEVSNQLIDLVDLVNLVISWEHGLSIDKLAYHATNSPHIGSFPVRLSN